ncbi:MAG: VTT domain-containing protein [Candidatus Thiodiazotropha endolucinida]|nr:VTT domain-containing protein [Candidatus Thiodiazotropha endolucinida]
MRKKLKRFFAPGMVPFLLAIAFSLFTIIYKIADFPPPSEMAEIAKRFYNEYGIFSLLVAAFVEGLFMVNIYFPGSFVILLAVFLSTKGLDELGAIALVSWVGFVLAGQLNYWMGRAGFYKVLLRLGKRDSVQNMQEWMGKRGSLAIFIAAIHPNFLAISQVCMGISNEGYRKNFLFSAGSLLFWVPFWTVVAAVTLKQIDLKDSNQAWYVVIIFLVWGLVLVVKDSVVKPLTRSSNGR